MVEKTKDSRSPIYILVPLGMVLALAMVLAACGGTTNSAQNPAAPADSGMNTAPDSSTSVDQPAPTDSAGEPAATDVMAQPEPTAETAAGLSFSADIFPILQSRCINCHGGERIEGELIMLSYEDLMAGGKDGQVIVPGDAANSLLVDLVTSLKMPKRGPKLTPVQIQAITDWVNQGALNN